MTYTLYLLAGAAEFAAWIAMIYFLASATMGRVFYTVVAWAERMEAKYRD